MYRWWKLVHLVGAFGFVLAHGVSAGVAMRLRRERQPDRVRALLDLSAASRGLFYGSTVVLLVGGIVTGFLGHWWGQGWIWASLGLLVVLMGAAAGLAVPYYRRVRAAVADPRPDAGELDRLLSSPRPLVIAWVGAGGLLVLLWLMTLKPF